MTRSGAEQLFDGVMLGDAGLVQAVPGGAVHFDIALVGKDKLAYLEQVARALNRLGIQVRDGYPKLCHTVSRGKPYTKCDLPTLSHPLLASEHTRWYNTGKKEVPPDLCLTPLSLSHWFMNDGSSSFTKYVTVYANLSTYCFSIGSIEILERELSCLGIGSSRGKDKRVVLGAGIRLSVLQSSVGRFMDIVEPYVVEPFKYKIKRRHGNERK